MWTIVLTTLHVIACIFLVIVVLLQKGKGSDVNAVFGGSSQTIFGSSGAGNFLTKLTSATAIVFMFTSLTLTIGNTKQGAKSVFDDVPAETTTPTTPEQPAASPQAESGAPAATTTTSTEKPTATAPATGATATTTPASDVTVTTTQVPATPLAATPPAAPSVTPVPAAPSAAASPASPKAPPASEKK